jgi:cyclic pyranopterin phosphate synthase
VKPAIQALQGSLNERILAHPISCSSRWSIPFGRTIRYLRVSVTDRCDLRCFYCMSEDMTFLPKADLLTLEELDRLCSAFIAKGVRKIRLTGGEPLVRRNVMSLVRSLSRHLSSGALDELTLTTNASQLARFAGELRDCGVRRVNVSLDTLDAQKFRAITRWGDLDKVLAGIEAARDAGLAVKINAVALKNMNEEEIPSLMEWAHGKGMALTLIEVMPMGDIGEGRIDQYVPLSLLRARLAKHYTLTDLDDDTGGPARYVRVAETGGKLGFITPMTHNFCESCNRVRITCTGTLHTCLGHEDASDLRKPLRASADNDLLSAAIDRAIGLKPKGHDFIIDRRHNRPSVQPPHERHRRLNSPLNLRPPATRICQANQPINPRVNLSIFRLTPPRRAEMVRLLHASTAGTGRCIPRVAVKTAVARDGGGLIVAIASANELRACAFFARQRPCAFGAGRQLQSPARDGNAISMKTSGTRR